MKRGERSLERGQLLYAQGQRTGEMYTVLDGILIRYRTLDDGRRQIVNFMFPGNLLGLQAAFDEPCGHSVEALIPARVCVFDRADFQPLIAAHPRLGFDIVWMAAKEETELEQHIVSLGQRNARERVTALAVWLLERAIATGLAEDGNRLAIPMTQVQIADMMGLSPVHANRTLQSLRRDDLVDWKPTLLVIPDMRRAIEFARVGAPNPRKSPYI
ncbi:Nitrogen fixation regulation protein FixK [Tsuneonella dongtanensis]|uniref:Nitrogen fixation regulation protein FixK n=1 Tax=Tsuneonella dongtanensis TaxID=692370 RepID=A0A1B2AC34_9SPHN|nr:Crp/Fnr family transcriptional regulator [Tsuneonella dongtanensis]ANY19722.1 Nitrogen fixation regulation protein FixK [Tsuneonella dongtanensis]